MIASPSLFSLFSPRSFLIKAKDNMNYYLFAWAHVIDATYINRRVGAMQPYAEKWIEPLPGSRSRTTSNIVSMHSFTSSHVYLYTRTTAVGAVGASSSSLVLDSELCVGLGNF